MLRPEEIAIALEDVRGREAATMTYLLFAERKTTMLVGLYVTLGLITGGIALAGLGHETIFSHELLAASFAAAVVFLVGAVLAVAAARGVSAHPTVGAHAWQTVSAGDEFGFGTTASQYLRDADARAAANLHLTETASRYAGYVQAIGVLAPIVGIIAGVVVWRG